VSSLAPGAVPRLLAAGFVFAEGPRWHDGRLWLSDMHGEAVYTVTMAGESVRQLHLPGRKPSGIGFLPEGSALIVSMGERQLIRLYPDGKTSSTPISARSSPMS
jgi:sugar lactone lactonase YvrE